MSIRPVGRAAAEPSTQPIPIDEVWAPDEPGRPGPAHPAARRAGSGTEGRLRALLERCWPAAWRSARVDPGRPAATALVLVAMLAAACAAVAVWAERPQAQPVGGLPSVSVPGEPTAGGTRDSASVPAPAAPGLAAGPANGSGSANAAAPAVVGAGTASTPEPPAAPLVVSVSGKVHRPGLVEVPPGARVADVLAAAGGVLPGTNLAQLNLARRVSDGEQIAVGVPAAPDAAAPPAAGPAAAGTGTVGAPAGPGARLNLNAATLDQLDGLPGIGPVTAQRILEWRTRNGRFSQVEQLREIEGIGERRFGQLRELVTV